jgi:protein translocase SecG subunit
MLTTFLIVFLSGFLFLDCIVLIFLVLLQLPKKEAGAGMAFGGSATDALFGAGSGNALTTITKYSAGFFFGAALLLSIITSVQLKNSRTALQDALSKSAAPSSQPGSPLAPADSTKPTVPLAPLQEFPAPAAPSSPSAPPAASPTTPPAASPAAPPTAPPAAAPAAPPTNR